MVKPTKRKVCAKSATDLLIPRPFPHPEPHPQQLETDRRHGDATSSKPTGVNHNSPKKQFRVISGHLERLRRQTARRPPTTPCSRSDHDHPSEATSDWRSQHTPAGVWLPSNPRWTPIPSKTAPLGADSRFCSDRRPFPNASAHDAGVSTVVTPQGLPTRVTNTKNALGRSSSRKRLPSTSNRALFGKHGKIDR